jgi:hypothetical protein
MPKGSAKANKKSAELSLKTPPHEAMPGLPLEAPSTLHLVQFKEGGSQITSLRTGTLGL